MKGSLKTMKDYQKIELNVLFSISSQKKNRLPVLEVKAFNLSSSHVFQSPNILLYRGLRCVLRSSFKKDSSECISVNNRAYDDMCVFKITRKKISETYLSEVKESGRRMIFVKMRNIFIQPVPKP